MSVPKSKRKKSQFEVFHSWYQLRKELMDLVFRDFGYSRHKFDKKLEHRFGSKPYDEMSDVDKATYDRYMMRAEAFDEWFLLDSRNTVMKCIREISANIFAANSIYPVYYEELVRRRLHQDEALGWCYILLQELQFAIDTLPVSLEVYARVSKSVEAEIALIKGWRQSDNRFKKLVFNPKMSEEDKQKVISDSAANFANVNNNGNANYNNASNVNGVRPDFDNSIS